MIWVTKEGEHILIARMGTSHLVNTLRMIERHFREHNWSIQYIKRYQGYKDLYDEAFKRGIVSIPLGKLTEIPNTPKLPDYRKDFDAL